MLRSHLYSFLFYFFANTKAQRSRCLEFDLPIQVSFPSYAVQLPIFQNEYETTNLLSLSTRRDAVPPSVYLGDAINVTKTFSINYRYCPPQRDVKRHGILQILTHGFGWDKSYWSFKNSTYDYVEAATAAGYAVLSYDRLGTGESEKPDPYTLIQTQIDLAILKQLTTLVRGGKLSPRIPAPLKIVHVGHSYGSLLTNALIAESPDLSDAVVLTGYTHNDTWTNRLELSGGFRLARENQPARFGHLHPGYLTWVDQYAHQFAFFSYPNFDIAVLQEAEKWKWPFALGQLVTYFNLEVYAEDFRGPVLMFNGANDNIFCGGNCETIIDGPDSISPSLFPSASILSSYLQPDTGHGINLHYNASASYKVMYEFLDRYLEA